MATKSYNGNLIRNLLYHIYPTKSRGVWQWNVTQLLRRMDQFNGQRMVSIATDETTDTFDTVVKFFRGTVKDFQHVKNDKTLGELVSFQDLLKRVENIDPRQITFYGHAKGVKYPVGTVHMVHRWSEVMYSNMLDYPNLIEDSLRKNPFVGTFLKSGNTFGSLPPAWHYAGTYFWFRNAMIFDKANWNQVPLHWWGTEAWPGVICPKENADCLLYEGSAPSMQLYSREYWQTIVNPVWKEWQITHSPLRGFCSYSEVINTLRALGTKKILVSGPQRSGTMITTRMLSSDLKIPMRQEKDFDVHEFEAFKRMVDTTKEMVLQCPTMSPYIHLLPYTVIWVRRDLKDILRSQKRIDWNCHEQQERDRYFDHTKRPAAVVKTEAWEKFQRIVLGERAFDLDYKSLEGHPLWIDQEKRVGFKPRQTGYPSQ